MMIFLLGLAVLVAAIVVALSPLPRLRVFALMVAGAILVSWGTAQHERTRCDSIGCDAAVTAPATR